MKFLLHLFAAAALSAASYETAGFVQFPAEVKPGAMSSIDVDRAGNLYVLHRGEQPLAKFDASGKYVKSWGGGMFKVPHGLRVGPDGNIWTTDNGSHVLRVFTPDGKLLKTIGEAGVAGSGDQHFRSPDDLVFSSKKHLYVADAGNARILHFDAGGKLLSQWGHQGKAPGEFTLAHSMSIDKQDRIYVGDRGNNRVQVFDSNGKLLKVLTGFGNPFGVLAADKDRLVTAEGEKHQLFLVNVATGSVIEELQAADRYQLPHLMALGKRGTFYLTEVDGKRVRILRRSR